MSEVATVISPQLVAILDRPSLCVGEDRGRYDQLRNMIIDEIKPATVTEYMLAYDIAEAEWELLRLHGFKAGMINAHMLPVFEDRSRQSSGNLYNEQPAVLQLFRKAFAGDPEAGKTLKKRLAKYNLTLQEVAATAYEPTSQRRCKRST